MIVRDLQNIIRRAPPLAPGDTVAKAVRLLRARGLPAWPVAERDRLVGLVLEADLLALTAGEPNPRQIACAVPVFRVMRPIDLIATQDQSVLSLAQSLRERSAAAIPVATADGRYLGLILARDILAAITGEPLVPPIAGLATPRGIYLTTGALRAGAGDLSLAATGAALMVINLIAGAVLYGLAKLAHHLLSSPGGAPAVEPSGSVALAAVLLFYGLQMSVFLLLLRLSPLTRVHGAEHMVVYAVEEGEDLTPEKVRQMPRVHPRCGTNLMALLILLIIAQQFLASVGEAVDDATRFLTLFALVMIVLLTWRRLGAGLQRWVTTRRPSDRQLANAIDVAQDLLEKVRSLPAARAKFPRRIWNSGFLQVLAGFLAVAVIAEYGGPLLAQAWSWLTG